MLPCGHHRTCEFSYVHKGQRRRYCLACLIDKIGLPTIDEQRKGLVKEEPKEIMTREEIAKVADREEKKSLTPAERMANARAARKS